MTLLNVKVVICTMHKLTGLILRFSNVLDLVWNCIYTTHFALIDVSIYAYVFYFIDINISLNDYISIYVDYGKFG